MRKFFTLFLALMTVAPIFAVNTVRVKIAMNATATHFDIIPLESQSKPDVTEVISREYEMEVVPGTKYQLATYNKNKVWVGSIVLAFDFNDSEEPIYIYTPSVKVKNSGWTLGTDCTASVSLEDVEGASRQISTSEELGYITFPAVKGDNYTIIGTPSQQHADEGYLTCRASDPVTFNRTVNLTFPMGYDYSLTVPNGADVFLGYKNRHFVPFTGMPVKNTVNNANGTTTYTYTLGEKVVYNYRVNYTDPATGKKYTAVAEKFTMSSEAAHKEITLSMLSGIPEPGTVVTDPAANNGSNVSDILLNADYRGIQFIKSGDTHQIVNLRNWEISDNLTNNYFFEPDFHYTVTDLEGKPCEDIISVDGNGLITAKSKGTAIVLVTYDALYSESQLGGPFFGAIDPENTGVIIVRVDETGGIIRPNTCINSSLNAEYYSQRVSDIKIDAELDMLYFTQDHATYTFSPERVTDVLLASPSFTTGKAAYTGFSYDGVTLNADGSYTLSLPAGRNIVMLKGTDGATTFQVIRAKKCGIEITNLSNPDQEPAPGDEVSVRIDGIYHPANKVACVYNYNAAVSYALPSGERIDATPNQYQFASSQAGRTVTLTIPEDWNKESDFVLSDGAILCGNYGELFGSHRTINYNVGRSSNFTSLQRSAYFGSLPSVILYRHSEPDGIEDVKAEMHSASDIIYDTMGRRVTGTPGKGIYIISGKKVFLR